MAKRKTKLEQVQARELQLRRRAAEMGHMVNRDEKLRALEADAIMQEMTRLKGVLSATPSNVPTARMLDKLKQELKSLTYISRAGRNTY